ncbi:BatD family protein [Joostella sp.]|uniref:BatD family protein n=1 Tax=Joostella sp. TaxID=2231138 RepID=UPI003A933042
MKQNGNVIYVVLALMLCLFVSSKATSQTLWGEVSLNKSSVYVGEPVQVSVTVYTSTWFTTGLDLGNIKVNGAFTIYFRPVSKSFSRNGQNYAGVQLIYHVFPFSEDDVTFPALEIEVETPAPGGYKGVKRIVKTKEKVIKVKPTPPSFKGDEWLVASSLTASERWSGNRNNVKVGDVLVRTITRKVGGTVPELIPPTVWDTVPNVSMYPGRSTIDSYKSKTAISAQRTETIQYLFEKEGETVIPDKVYTWYNPYRQKLYKKTIKGFSVNVAANPDLGMLESVRDSLKLQEEKIVAETKEKEPLTILGLSVKDFIIAAIIVIAVLLIVIYLLRKLITYIIKRRKAYRNSELYYFNQLKRTVGSSNKNKIMDKLYRWIDEIDIEEPSAHYLLMKYDLKREVDINNIASSLNAHKLKNIRKNYLNRNTQAVDTNWINP